MRFLGFCLLLLSPMPLLAQQASDPADSGIADLAARIKKLSDRIEELRARQSALVDELKRCEEQKQAKQQQLEEKRRQEEAERQRQEELARQKAEEAEKKQHFAKVEIRGTLVKVPAPIGPGDVATPAGWYITINQLKWKLSLPADKKTLELAEQLVGKGVVVTGTVVNVNSPVAPIYPQPYPVYPYVPGGPLIYTPVSQPVQYPNPWPGPGPYPQPQPQITTVPVEMPVTIDVESLKPATGADNELRCR